MSATNASQDSTFTTLDVQHIALMDIMLIRQLDHVFNAWPIVISASMPLLVPSVSLVTSSILLQIHVKIKDLLSLALLAICQGSLPMLLKLWQPLMLPLVLDLLPLVHSLIHMVLCRFVNLCI